MTKQKLAFIHGHNMGDTILACQGVYHFSREWDVTFVTDKYNVALLEWLSEYTDLPLSGILSIETPASMKRFEPKLPVTAKAKPSTWKKIAPGFDKYEITDNSLVGDTRKMVAGLARKFAYGDPVRLFATNVRPARFHDIVVVTESWHPARRWHGWNDVTFPSSDVVQIYTGDELFGPTRKMDWASSSKIPRVKIENEDFMATAEAVLGARLVVAIATMTPLFSAAFGVPTIAIHTTDYTMKGFGSAQYGFPWDLAPVTKLSVPQVNAAVAKAWDFVQKSGVEYGPVLATETAPAS